MESRQNCAYNRTRECFLGLEVVAGDFSSASLSDWMPTLTPNSGAGIWLTPFRGIPASDERAPLDLLYLDEDCRVLDTVEFFPAFRVSPASPPAASVLALPTHSIFSSHTQKGDQLMLCAAGELEGRLEQLSQPEAIAGAAPAALSSPIQYPVPVREESQRTARPAPLEAQDLPVEQKPAQSDPAQDKPLAEPAGKPITPPRGWLERWLFPDPADPRRGSPRQPAPGLAAHFWTGGAPQAHDIRDISASGLYVVTDERWYPGTLIRMTLSKPDIGHQPAERSITVQARCVRWGNDGVGLEFVLEDPRSSRRGQPSTLDGVDSNQFNRFLKRLSDGSH